VCLLSIHYWLYDEKWGDDNFIAVESEFDKFYNYIVKKGTGTFSGKRE